MLRDLIAADLAEKIASSEIVAAAESAHEKTLPESGKNASEDGDEEEHSAPAPPKKSKGKAKATMPKEQALQRNQKNWAKGVREDLILKPKFAAFQAARRNGTVALRTFFASVKNEFFAKIPWDLPDHVEPELPLPEYDPKVVPLNDDEDMLPEEREGKAKKIAEIGGRIERYYKNRDHTKVQPAKAAAAKTKSFNVQAWLVATMFGVDPPKHARQPYQQLMHESYATDVAPLVNARWAARQIPPNATKAQREASPPPELMAEVAREIVANNRSLSEALHARAQAQAKAEKALYEGESRGDPSSVSPEDRQTAIDLLPKVMKDVLEALMALTGYQFVLAGGGPVPEYEGDIRTVTMSVGQNNATVPLAFPDWNSKFNDQWIGPMKAYLETAYTTTERQEAALKKKNPLDDKSLLSLEPTEGVASSSTTSSREPSRRQSTCSPAPNDDNDSESNGDDRPDGEGDNDGNNDGEDIGAAAEEEEDRRRRAAFKAMRDANIACNEALMAEIFKDGVAKGVVAAPKPPQAPRTRKQVPTGPVRRSGRNAAPDAMETDGEKTTDADGDSDAMDVGLTDGEKTTDGHDKDDAMDVEGSEDVQTSHPSTADKEQDGSLEGRVGMELDGPTGTADVPPPCLEAIWLTGLYHEIAGRNLGPRFNGLLAAYLELKGAWGWVDGSGLLSADNRPKQVGQWVKNKRRATVRYCGIPNITLYEKQWWAWWNVNQPGWRVMENDRPRATARYGESWGGLLCPGLNGMLNVVVSLYWWGMQGQDG
ncbi:hypothetical protein C8F01DRAFT_1075377 [Mycena amicta]|nr:hypothetical protein C8F01DRAFT_1075377 [Mycena amicta]